MYWVIYSISVLWSWAAEAKQEVNFCLPSTDEWSHPPLTLSSSCSLPLCIFFIFYLQTPALPTFPPRDIKGVEKKTKTATHPHRAAQCQRLDVYHAEVRVQHLIPSELLQVFVDFQGLEVRIWVVFIISGCTQQQETTLRLYETSTGATRNGVSHAKHMRGHLNSVRFPTHVWVIYGMLFVGAKAALHSHKMNGLRSNSLFTVICCIQFTLFPLSIPSAFYIPIVLINCRREKKVLPILYTILVWFPMATTHSALPFSIVAEDTDSSL